MSQAAAAGRPFLRLPRVFGHTLAARMILASATLALEKVVANLESGLGGFVLTRNERFMQPWLQARRELSARKRAFLELAQRDPVQRRRARGIVQMIDAYVVDYGVPLIQIVRENPAAARSTVVEGEGKTRADAIRRRFRQFLLAENARAAASAANADQRSDTARILAVTGLFASAALIVLFGLLLARGIARPVRRGGP